MYAIVFLTGHSSYAKSDAPYEQQLKNFLGQARSSDCSNAAGELTSVLCAQKIRIGVRNNYPSFGQLKAGQLEGFEIKVAMDIASKLGLVAQLVPVTAANRIEKLIKGDIDMVLATMAHTTTREKSIHFVRPHYYSSPTSIVGPQKIKADGWSDLAGRSVCVPLGNFSNLVFSEHQVRMMIYDRPDRMVEAFNMGACSLIAHDQSFLFGSVLADSNKKSGPEGLEEKFSFNDVPWGIGVRKAAASSLGHALGLAIADMHQSGRLLDLAGQSGIKKVFLEKQQALWSSSNCFGALLESPDADCLLAPVHLADQPSSIEAAVVSFEGWLAREFDVQLRFPMLSGSHGLNMFLNGMVISVALVLSSISATLLFAYGFYALSRFRIRPIRIAGSALRLFFQNSPIILLLMLGYLLVTALLDYSTWVAVLIAVVMIGLNNGANGANALMDAAMTFKSAVTPRELFGVASVALRAAVINAAKASPVAAFIGAPEMLASLTDITSFTGERVTTYLIVSIFYIVFVQVLVVVTGIFVKEVRRHA
ncbi:MAG: transporter substrate-binding domain-containing protein [Betaproteobacteria bacterium]